MDGNGRWATTQGKPRTLGHAAGVESVRKIIVAAAKRGVEVLTLYTFSEENWHRPHEEVQALMGLLVEAIYRELPELQAQQVKLDAIGELERLPLEAQKALTEVRHTTAHNKGLHVVLALSYSSHSEITHAATAMAQEMLAKGQDATTITESDLSRHLYTSHLPQVDLLIRAGGECRLSNFLLWQLAYAELYFCDTYWPDFDEAAFTAALQSYTQRQRRYGRTGEQILNSDRL